MRLSLLLALAGAVPSTDVIRARTRKPGDAYRAPSLDRANAALNAHLEAKSLRTQACEKLSLPELRATMKAIFLLGDDALKTIYAPEDGRAPRFSSVAELEAHWEKLENAGADSDVRVRDGHCHEAVMWYVHHLSEDGQAAFGSNASLSLPLLPLADHTGRADGSAAHTAYSSSVTCQKCHVGGIDNLGVPEAKPETDLAIKRRCYISSRCMSRGPTVWAARRTPSRTATSFPRS